MAFYYEVASTYPEVVTLDQAKKQLKLEDLGVFDDALIQDCIDSAIEESEHYTNTSIYKKIYKYERDSWVQDVEFNVQPIISIDKITYKDVDGNDVVLIDTPLSDFVELIQVDKYAKKIHFKDWDNIPTLESNQLHAVVIELTTGYATADKLPKSLLQSIKLLLTDNYNYRGDREQKSNTAAQKKLESYKYYRCE